MRFFFFFLIVQHECIPQAVLGMDILCQAKSGMGKTAVFVLATLQQLELTENQVYVLVMCHTRELAFQISKEYERFSKYMPAVKVNIQKIETSRNIGNIFVRESSNDAKTVLTKYDDSYIPLPNSE